MKLDPTIAYFSMEIGLDPAVPTYSGGLGVLAGDSLRAAADLKLPMIAVTLVHRRGYFYQRLDAQGNQTEEPVDWALDDYLMPLEARVALTLEGRQVQIAAWQFEVVGITGFKVPIVLLDTDLPEGEVSRQMFGHYPIDAITNGIHSAMWTSPPIAEMFDEHIPGWREDTASLRYAMSIERHDLWNAHQKAKRRLIEEVNRDTNAGFDQDVFTIGFARRATAYKRPALILTDMNRLKRISQDAGAFQLIYAGKAHPNDGQGKQIIRSIVGACRALRPEIRAVYLPNYDMEMSRLMTAGVDLWLNTPQPPMEASGTSGMKAAVNGVPSLSILDGWWLEGCIEGVTGWAIGDDPVTRNADGSASVPPSDEAWQRDSDSLYRKLEEVILPLFYEDRTGYTSIMRHAIAINGSFFNTRRMMQNYVTKAYFD